MRIALTLLLVAALGLPPLAHAQSPDADAGLAQAADETLLALKRAVLSHEEAPREHAPSPVEEARQRVFAQSLVPAEPAVAAWERALEASGNASARERVLVAEAALLEVAAASARAAHAAGEREAASAWLDVVLGRVDGAARQLDALQPDALDDAESLDELLRAALAARAREEAVQGMLLQHAGLVDEARASATGASAMAALVAPDAQRLLPPEMLSLFEENRTELPEALLRLPEARKDHALSGFLAPLVALEFNRDIEPLDEFGSRNLDAVLVAARAAREDPALAEVLARQAFEQYSADRAGLFLRGEGTLDAADARYRAFRNATTGAPGAMEPAQVREAARGVVSELRKVALLERGIVLKVEVGGLQPGRVHEYVVTLVRPPLEGIDAYRVEIAYDPGVARILGAIPLQFTDDLRQEVGEDRIVLEVASGEALARSAHLAKLRIQAVGPPEARTNLTIVQAAFHEPDGDAAGIFRLRHGEATVAVMPSTEDEDAITDLAHGAPTTADREVPGFLFPVGLGAIAVAALSVRRQSA